MEHVIDLLKEAADIIDQDATENEQYEFEDREDPIPTRIAHNILLEVISELEEEQAWVMKTANSG